MVIHVINVPLLVILAAVHSIVLHANLVIFWKDQYVNHVQLAVQHAPAWPNAHHVPMVTILIQLLVHVCILFNCRMP